MPVARRPRVIGVAAPLACAAAILVGPAAAEAADTDAGAVAGHEVHQSPADVREFWTEDRMRDAEPLEAPVAGSGVIPSGDPPPDLYAISPDLDTDPAADVLFPQRIHGKLFITIGGRNGSCSATVVKSFRANLILTAGHCVAEPAAEGGGTVQWATNVLFVPGYRNFAAPLGTFAATELRAPSQWLREGGDIAFDVGAVNLTPGAGGQIQEWLGARGITFNRPDGKYKNNVFEIFGYPGQPPPYDAQALIVCNSPFLGFEAFSGGVAAGPCHQQQGSSGGGWVRKGKVNSVVSHGGCIVPSTACEVTIGTYLGDTAYKLWDAAAGSVPKGRRKRLKKCKKIDKAPRKQSCKSKARTYGPVVR